jgi:nicotinate-nucleotide adenylyltransferase
MTRLATASNPFFEVSRLELEREGPSYSLLTIQHFREQVGAEDLYFIAGADTVLELLTWYSHEEVIRLCRFIAAARPGYNLDRMKAVLPPDYIQRIDVLEVPQVDVSSTEIRERIREGRSIRYLTPDPVADYIRDRGLYR